MGALFFGSALANAADRSLGWLRPGPGALERELNEQARRGLRLAAVSDGLPACAVVVMQAPETAGALAAYRVVADRTVAASLGELVEQGFVPRASWRGLGLRHDVVFERVGPPSPAGAWRAVEFESLDALAEALRAAAAEGYRPRLLVRPAFRSWPGLSERGIVLVHQAPGATPVDVRVIQVSRRDVDDFAREVATATASGWQLDLLFAQARDGGATGRRERAVVLLSKPQAAVPARPLAVTIERQSSFGILGDRIVGAAAFWDEVLVASVDDDRRQAWATPVKLGDNAARCGPLGLGFRFDAPGDLAWNVTGLMAVPAPSGGGTTLLVLTDQRLGGR